MNLITTLINNIPIFIRKNWFSILLVIIVLRFILIVIATSITYQLAWNVTESIGGAYYIGEPYGYELIKWDNELKELVYLIYGFVLVVEIMCIHIIVKLRNKNIKVTLPLASILFVLSFPTLNSWPIEVPCNRATLPGFGCSQTVELITPTIMSHNPIYFIISCIISMSIFWVYTKYIKATSKRDGGIYF